MENEIQHITIEQEINSHKKNVLFDIEDVNYAINSAEKKTNRVQSAVQFKNQGLPHSGNPRH
jgi:hypothetical protein